MAEEDERREGGTAVWPHADDGFRGVLADCQGRGHITIAPSLIADAVTGTVTVIGTTLGDAALPDMTDDEVVGRFAISRTADLQNDPLSQANRPTWPDEVTSDTIR